MSLFNRTFSLIIISCLATSCASIHRTEVTESDSSLEKINKTSYNVTDWFDQYLLKPIAQGYKVVVPDPAEQAIGRAFGNIREVGTVVNGLMQGKLGQAANDTGRVLVNTTLGVVGLFEVAESMGLEKNDPEDFGQTLAVWGVGSGPYVYIPMLGPSTLRDAPSKVVDYFLNPLTYIEDSRTSYIASGSDLIQQRAGLIESEEIISGDRYEFIKDAYLQRREYLINDAELSDELDDFDTDF